MAHFLLNRLNEFMKDITLERAIKLGDAIARKQLAHLDKPFGWISMQEWRPSYPMKNWEHNWMLLPLGIVDERFIACVDVGYGHDVVIDLKKEEVHWSKQGIFQPDWCFLSDYYGYPDGAFFAKV